MAFKRTYKFNYKLRLFLPITALIWIIIAVMVIYAFNREKQYRYDNIQSEIELINRRIVDMMQHGYDVNRFLRFIEKYYATQELQGIRVSIFQGDEDFPDHFIGEPVFTEFDDMGEDEKVGYYCFARLQNDDLGITVRTALPHNLKLTQWEVFGSGFWIFVFIMGLAATALSYITAAHMASNVTLLRDFTERASTDQNFTTTDKFTNDELGDISRRIIDIYNERKVAQAAHEREHQIALKASEEKARLKRQITNNVNHELKTPVGIIKGYIETLLAHKDMDDVQKFHFIEKTYKQVERLTIMLDDLSTLTRLDDASGMIPTREVDMNQLLETLDEEIYESGIGGDLIFVYELPEHCIVKGSESLINAAILNLVKNAAAYSKGSEMGLLCKEDTNDFYSFVFYDNGTGLDEEHLPKLFERFYRVESGRSRKTGGTGLGLSIVKSTIVSMGGSISVSNGSNGGLEFTFTLPKWHQEK